MLMIQAVRVGTGQNDKWLEFICIVYCGMIYWMLIILTATYKMGLTAVRNTLQVNIYSLRPSDAIWHQL